MAEALLGDSTLLEIGAHCSLDSCRQSDFLPIACPHCSKVFCNDHWRPCNDGQGSREGHVCEEAQKADRIVSVPACSLCNAAVAVDRGSDPNIAMDAHLSSACPVLDPRTGLAARQKGKAKDPNECAAKGCHTKIIAVKFDCKPCHRSYCAKHRFPNDHACAPPVQAAPAKKPGLATKVLTKRNSAGQAKTPQRDLTPAKGLSQPGLAALRRAKSSAAERLTGQKPTVIDLDDTDDEVEIVSSTSKSASSKPSLPFNKSDRRAKTEKANAIKSLEGRAAKGLLNDDQKLELAMLKAKGMHEKDDGCVVT